MHRRLVVATIITAAVSTAGSLGAPDAAFADRCQPEELVLDEGNSPLGQDGEDLRCPIMQNVVYDQVACDDTQFMTCVRSIDARGTVERQRDCFRYGFRVGALCNSVESKLPPTP